MIVTGIFLFLLGTKLGEAATKTEVKYEGLNKITVKEEKDDRIMIPGLGSPPFALGIIHQGSNFFFNPKIVLPGGFIPTKVEMQPVQSIAVEPSIPCVENNEVPAVPILIEEPIQEVDIHVNEIPPPPELPPLVISEIPRPVFAQENKVFLIPSAQEPSIPCVENNEVPVVPILIEEPIHEVDIHCNEIPPPPELPPLIISEIPRPVFAQENKVFLIPSAQEPSIPCVENNEVPAVPILIEEPIHEVNIHVNEIPPPPELPPLIISEIPKPVFEQENKVFLNPSAQEPSIPCVENNEVPAVPILIEEPIQEVDIHCNEIPPPPELPPLVISEIPRPVFAQENKVILIPSAQEPSIPCVENNEVPAVPILIEEPMHEVDIYVNEIPPPPELPPLIISEIPRPVFAQENKVFLIPSAQEPSIPCVENNEVPAVPILIEEPIQEVDIHCNEIPPPPELPPLIISEIPKPVFEQEKKVILNPSAQEPSKPCVENNEVPAVTILIEEPIHEVNIHVNEIPPPPELPPLVISEIPRPVFEQEKKVILNPSAQEPSIPCVEKNEVPAVPIPIEEPIHEVDIHVNELPPPPELPPLIISEIPRPVFAQENKVFLIPSAQEPSIPCVENNEVPAVPILIEEPIHEVIIHVNEIPPPPELPPLIISEIPRPVFEQEKKVILNPSAQEPSIPCVENNEVPAVPILIEEPIHEVNIHVNEIPPPPELPPLIISEIPRPVFEQEKKVILIPLAQEPSIPCVENNEVPAVPILIEEPIHEVNIHVNEIPPPPELPPLIISEIPRPVFEQEKKVILNPSAQEPSIPCVENNEIPAVPILIEEPIQEVDIHVNEIPPPPELPPLIISEIPRPVFAQEKRVILNPSAQEPSIPCVENNEVPAVPILIEEPIQEVDIHVNEIPPPPELPPLVISEIPRPVFAQEKKVILIPSAPERSLIPTDCVQNIVMERFLPNVAFENGKMVELISIPATKRAPVVSSIMY